MMVGSRLVLLGRVLEPLLEGSRSEGMQDAILPLIETGGPTGITRLHAELLRRLLFLSLPDKTRSEVQGLGGLDCYDGIVGWRGKQRAVSPAVTVWFGIE
jgi:hypothetical protein